MLNKQKDIETQSAGIMRTFESLLSVSPDEIIQAMRRFMDQKELQMFDLAHFCEQETIKAQQAGAHFAACLMGAAMNEALLALVCLKYETEVMATNQFKYSTRKKPRPFRDVIANWRLEQFLNVADECKWIPAAIVDKGLKLALAEGFRELMPVTHPELTEEEIARGAESFLLYPGTAMMRMTQELRNCIHAGKWIRGKSSFVAERLSEWCHLGTILSGEIRLCLLHLIMRRDVPIGLKKISEAINTLDALTPESKALLEKYLKAELKLSTNDGRA